MSNVSAINLETGALVTTEIKKESICGALQHKHAEWERYRQDKESIWLEAWAMYIGSSVSETYLRNEVGHIVGDVLDDWRHRLNNGKAYETIETAVAYLMQAFFPNQDYFQVMPEMAGYRDDAKRTTAWMKEKLRQADVKTHWEMFLRQCLITGFSTLSFPWHLREKQMKRRVKKTAVDPILEVKSEFWDEELYNKVMYNNTELEVLDSFDVLIDPCAKNLQDAAVIRHLKKTASDIVQGYHNGVYAELDIEKFLASVKKGAKKGGNASGFTERHSHKDSVASFLGLQYDPELSVECYEYWGGIDVDNFHLEDVVITIINGQVARVQDIPYWCGKPFVTAVAVPVPNHVYGLGMLEPVLGMIHESNILTNSRLDNLTIAIQDTYTMVNDGVTNPDDVYRAPGHVIQVGDHNSVRPLEASTNFTISYSEAEYLQGRIDSTTGVGAYVSASPGRNAERVTAEEVAAVREAGGTRLSSVHRHIESTAFIKFLEKWLYMARQFVVEDEAVQMPGDVPGETKYYAVGQDELNKEYRLYVVGADFIAQRDRVLRELNSFIETVISVPQWAEMINWESLLEEYVMRYNFSKDIEELIIRGIKAKTKEQQEAAAAAAQAAPQSGADEMMNIMQDIDGAGGVRYQQGQEAVYGADGAMARTAAQLSGQSPDMVEMATEFAQSQSLPPM